MISWVGILLLSYQLSLSRPNILLNSRFIPSLGNLSKFSFVVSLFFLQVLAFLPWTKREFVPQLLQFLNSAVPFLFVNENLLSFPNSSVPSGTVNQWNGRPLQNIGASSCELSLALYVNVTVMTGFSFVYLEVSTSIRKAL